jgi:hypothetical protein
LLLVHGGECLVDLLHKLRSHNEPTPSRNGRHLRYIRPSMACLVPACVSTATQPRTMQNTLTHTQTRDQNPSRAPSPPRSHLLGWAESSAGGVERPTAALGRRQGSLETPSRAPRMRQSR